MDITATNTSTLKMINKIVVYRGDTVDYYALNCWEFLKPFCLYGVKTETSKGMAQGEIKALATTS